MRKMYGLIIYRSHFININRIRPISETLKQRNPAGSVPEGDVNIGGAAG